MKTLPFRTMGIVAGLACLSAYSVAQAGTNDFDYPPRVKFESTVNRDDVRTDFITAARQGTLPAVSEASSSSAIAGLQSTKTRADVNAEYLEAMKEGSLPQTGEGYSTVTAIAPTSNLTREAVTAETKDWMRAQRSDVMMGGK